VRRAAWQQDGRAGIGASEVPVLAGASPYATPVALWMDKVGLTPPRADTDAMAMGRALEGTVLTMGAEALGLKLRRNHLAVPHKDWPRIPLWGTPDGFTANRRVLAEVKVVAHRFSDWQDGPPEYVGLQVQAQLACVRRADHGVVIALVGGTLRTYHVERDQQVQDALPELVRDWWQRYVLTERAPDATGPDDQWALLRTRLRPDPRPERLAVGDEQLAGSRLARLMTERQQLDGAIEQARLELAQLAGQNDLVGLNWAGRWTTRRTVDWRALAQSMGATDGDVERHSRTAPVFTFRRTSDSTEAA
jgi:putative phage-type endonuclease